MLKQIKEESANNIDGGKFKQNQCYEIIGKYHGNLEEVRSYIDTGTPTLGSLKFYDIMVYLSVIVTFKNLGNTFSRNIYSNNGEKRKDIINFANI